MKITDYKKAHITRTQAYIVNALFKLLKENSLDILTITEICQEADVARVTFYRNFESKEDILKLYIKILTEDYFSGLQKQSTISLKELSYGYFSYWQQNIDLLFLLKQNNLTTLLLEEYSIVEQYLKNLNKLDFSPKTLNKTQSYYRNAYIFAGLWRLIFLWIDRDCQESIEEMSQIFLKIQSPQ